MTDQPAPAPDDAAALAVKEVFRILRQYEDSRMVDSVEAEHSILARLAALPAHPPAPPEDTRPVVDVCPDCGRSDEHAAPRTAAHRVRLASYPPRVAAPPAPLPLDVLAKFLRYHPALRGKEGEWVDGWDAATAAILARLATPEPTE